MLRLNEVHPFRWLASRRGTEPLFSEYLRDKAFSQSFEDMDLTWPEFDAWLNATYPDLASRSKEDREDYREREMIALDANAKFIKAGRHVVAPTPALQRLLARTDLTGLRIGDFRLPYPTIHVALGSMSRLSVEGDVTEIDGITIGTGPNGRGIGLVFTTRLKAGPERKRARDVHDILPVVKVIIGDDDKTTDDTDLGVLVGQTLTKGVRLMQSCRIGLVPGGDVPAEYAEIRHLDEASYAQRLDTSRRRSANLVRATSLALNVLAYMMACPEDAAEEWPTDAPRMDAKAARHPGAAQNHRRHMLRQGFVPIRVIAPSLQESSGISGDGQPLSEAHWRRGHWRRQRVGVGLSEVRPVLIRPTVVRADLAMTPRPRLYTVEARAAAR